MEPGSLLHKTELIKSELCLSGTMLAIATEAAKYLGVDMDGKNSAALINECHRELASEPAGIVIQRDAAVTTSHSVRPGRGIAAPPPPSTGPPPAI
jgi:hypothetical protein